MKDLNFFTELMYIRWRGVRMDKNRYVAKGKTKLKFSPRYEVALPKHLMVLWEDQFIYAYNAAVDFLNEFFYYWTKDKNTRSYLEHWSLSKSLAYKFQNLDEFMREHNIKKSTSDFVKDPGDLDTFFTGIMKHLLVWVYAEIDYGTSIHKKSTYLKPDDIYYKFFKSRKPAITIIKKITAEQKPNSKSPILHPQVENSELNFNQIIKTPEQFLNIENLMVENELLDANKHIVPKYGNLNYLVAVIVLLHLKGYFNPFIFPGKIPIENYQIRQFFQSRYKCEFRKQYNHWLNNPEQHQRFIERYYWLDNLPACI